MEATLSLHVFSCWFSFLNKHKEKEIDTLLDKPVDISTLIQAIEDKGVVNG